MRVTFVVQRYGPHVIGGAEGLCRSTARALTARGHSVHVITTTAHDYLHWTPVEAAGTSQEDGVTVSRHDAATPDPARAADLTSIIATGGGTPEIERDWALAQGPVSASLLREVAASTGPVALWTYLYATSQLAAPLTRRRSILVPTAHNEAQIRFGLTRGVMNTAAGFAFLTPEERILVDDYFGLRGRPSEIVGAALPAKPEDAGPDTGDAPIDGPFVVYVGRMDPGKGVWELVDHHARYRRDGGTARLVFAGPGDPPPDLPDWAVHLGRVSEATRTALLTHAIALAMPSRNESYSLVLLEAWREGCPTIGTGHSPVIAGQTARSGGGFVYRSPDEYAATIRALEDNASLRDELGESGRKWAVEQTWHRVTDRWEALIAAIDPSQAPAD